MVELEELERGGSYIVRGGPFPGPPQSGPSGSFMMEAAGCQIQHLLNIKHLFF